MREIKFRGLNGERKEWVYGNLNDLISLYADFSHAGVHKNTVGEYTGLKDKNGKEIYDGDIVKDPDGNVFEVVWNTHAASFELVNNQRHYLFVQRYIDMFEVIGNIHDNPELMED